VQIRGEMVYGSKSWLKIAGFQFQPSQFAIGITILVGSLILSDGPKFLPILKYHFLRCLAAMAVFCTTLMFILLEGDLGSALVIIPVIIIMLVVGGIPFRYLIAGALVGLIVLPWIFNLAFKQHQQDRITVWWRMLHGQQVDLKGDAYDMNNNQIAIGSAGWEGKGIYERPTAEELEDQESGGHTSLPHMVGLGNISNKTAHTDYIYTVLSESFGFRVSGLVIMGFLLILLLKFMVAFFARDTMGRVLVSGVAGLIFGHAFEHIGMNIGLMPITGVPLPFISYGGTFLMVILFLFGMTQSVWVHRNQMLQSDSPDHQRSGARNRPKMGKLSPA
jgi:rod shape determining protein RodA